MRRFVLALVAATALALALPTGAGAATNWVCDVPGEGTVTFVSAPDAALHGISTANSTAGQLAFNRNFGEECVVVSD